MCIYYQDELGFCCKNGSDWSNFNNNTLCDSKRESTCDYKITIKDAEDMKRKLDLIRGKLIFSSSYVSVRELVNELNEVL